MKQRILVLSVVLVVALSACGTIAGVEDSSEPQLTYQDYYDLGVRYLSEGNYEEAIIAFTAAIEIDPKQALAYVGRGDAYIGSGKTIENLVAAQADYEMALSLDHSVLGVYLKLADVTIAQGKYDRALEVIGQAIENFGKTEELVTKFDAIQELWNSETTVRMDLQELYEIENLAGEGFISNYTRFDELSVENQSYIIQAVECVLEGNIEGIYAMLAEIIGKDLFTTIWSGYKIRIFYDEDAFPGEDEYAYFEIQLRTENGIGYYYRCDSQSQSHSTYKCYDQMKFQCRGWQINGAFTHYTRTEFTENSAWQWHEMTDSGYIEDNLLEGTVEEKATSMYSSIGESYSEQYWVYEHGRLIEDNGEAVDDSKVWSPVNPLTSAYDSIGSFCWYWQW